jgi:transposase
VLGERTSVGLDVHARSVVAAAIDGVTGELRRARLTPSHDHVRSWVAELPGPVVVAYEAGPTGFGLYRTLTAAGVGCVVAAPSKLQRPSGDRVKTDAKDALHLARLLRLGEITPVAVPSLEQEAARDLVRAREDCRGDLMRARHRLSKLLLRQGIIYSGGRAWTGVHDAWLRRQRFDTAATRMAFESDYDAVLAVQARRDRLDRSIGQLADASEFTPLVRRLGCLRGISTLTAFGARRRDR